MELTHQDVKSIIGIIDGAEHLNEVDLVFGGFRLHVRRNGTGVGEARGLERSPSMATPAPVASPSPASPVPTAAAPAPRAAAGVEASLAANEVAVRAPMLGTFYRAPSPGEKPFVEVGQRVEAADEIGVIEVMKLFKTINAGVDGTIVRIDAENATLVEFDQTLVVIARD